MTLLPIANARISVVFTAIRQFATRPALLWVKRHAPEFLDQVEDVQPNGKRHHRFRHRGAGYERSLRSVRDIHEKTHYADENPVRRGLVDRPTDGPCSSASAWETAANERLPIDRHRVPALTILDGDQAFSLMQ